MPVFTSEDNIIFNDIDIAATFNKDGGYFVVQNVYGRSMGEIDVITTSVPGRRGSYYRDKDIGQRTIQVDFALKAATYEALHKRLEQLNKLLHDRVYNSIRFVDELDRTYYGTVQNMQEAETNSKIHKGTITIICTDPLKYADEVEKNFLEGEVTVQNSGAVGMAPIFEFHVTQDISYLDVFTGEDYIRVGRASEDGLPPIEAKTLILKDELGSLSPWTVPSKVEGQTVMGTMSTNGYSINAATWGSQLEGWHGPALERGLPAQVQDFEMFSRVVVKNPTPVNQGKIAIELLDSSDNVVGRMVMFKNTPGTHGQRGTVRSGAIVGKGTVIDTAGDTYKEWYDFDGVMRISRVGNVWTGYIAQIDYAENKHHSRASGRFVDASLKRTAPISKIRVSFGKLGTRNPLVMHLHDVLVYRLNDIAEDRVPIIAKQGDVIRIDHGTSLITVNGEPRNDLKDFGANFFDIPKGVTTLLVEPKEAIFGKVRYREGYL